MVEKFAGIILCLMYISSHVWCLIKLYLSLLPAFRIKPIFCYETTVICVWEEQFLKKTARHFLMTLEIEPNEVSVEHVK